MGARPDDAQQGPAPAEGSPFVTALPRLVVEWLATAPESRARAVEGTMVFVDISGFTALSERLARRGKVGAEELTEILDGIFSRLLNRAWTLGGGLVKFGGDALLLLFTGADHANQACAAAFDMRLELREAGRFETSAGLVALEMSVGVHTGLFDFFLVGQSHRELLLTGPAASRTVEAESRADAGQILVTAETASRLGGSVLGVGRDGARLLESRPTAQRVTDAGVAGVDRLPLGSCVPVGLRGPLAAGAAEPEHRIVTVAFLHFLGVDALLAAEERAAVADVLEELVGAVQQRVDAHEVCLLGSDIYGDGGKLILIAGAPTTAGNDEERMLRALREVFDTRLPLRVRAGVNRGHVYAGEVGSTMRRTYTVMGDAVNLAARLMQAAEPGAILVADGVLECSRTEFEAEPLAPLTVKGKAKPVQAYRLGPVTGWKPARADALLPLIGRDQALGELDQALDTARRGHGRAVALLGAPGVGKSRLVAELREHASDTKRLTICCERYKSSTPFWAVGWLLRRLLMIPFDAVPEEAGSLLTEAVQGVAPDLLPWLPLIAATVDAQVPPTEQTERLHPAYRQDRLVDVTVDLVTRLLGEPTLLVFEDAFWMDGASRAILRRLCQDLEARPWLVVVVARATLPDLLPTADHVRSLELGPLAPQETIALATAATERDPRPTHERDALAQRSEGNPLFLLQLLASGRRGETDGLPETIEAAMSARIDTLEPAERTLLRCVSVLGVSFSTTLAAEALRTTVADTIDQGAWNRLTEFLEPQDDGRMRFRQALMCDVAYAGLPYRRRRAIHASVARRLEGATPEEADAHAELLAMHYLRAERHTKAWYYARVAGHRARGKGATVEAAAFYRQALDAAGQTDAVERADVGEVAELLGDVCELGGMYEQGASGYRAARRLKGHDTAAVAELLRKEGLLHERAGRYEHARRLYRTGLKQLGADGSQGGPAARVRADLQVVTAASLIVEGRYRAGVWWARRALDLAWAHDVRSVLAHAYYLLDWAFTDLGDAEAIAAYGGRAVAIYEELGDLDGKAKSLNNLGANAYYAGDWSEALACYERSREALQEIGNVVGAATVTSNIGEVLLQQGHLERADDLFREALGILRGAGHRIGEAWAKCNLGLIAGRSGNLADAVALLTDARETFQAIGAETYALEAVARLAEVSVMRGDQRDANTLVAGARAQAAAHGGLPLLEAALDRTLGYALLLGGDYERAAEALAESLARAEAAGATYEVALSLDALARAKRLTGEAAEAAATRSRALLDRLGVVATPEMPLPAELGSPETLRPGTAGR